MTERIRIVAGSVNTAARHHSVVVLGDASCTAEIASTKLSTAGRGIARVNAKGARQRNFLVNPVSISYVSGREDDRRLN